MTHPPPIRDCQASADYLELARRPGGDQFPLESLVTVDTDALNYRTEPGLSASIIMVLSSGTEAAILDGPVYADGFTWHQLGLPGYGPDGSPAGWVAGEFLAAR
ncbi:MAG: hypothetical protein ACRDJW_18660 [Thermomicrobiales bacterium]